VFIGDDRTDEDGFAIVEAMDGIAVKVGEGATRARHRVRDVPALRAWLSFVARALEGRKSGIA
jgi:trehalose 6-phosphate phosphatase